MSTPSLITDNLLSDEEHKSINVNVIKLMERLGLTKKSKNAAAEAIRLTKVIQCVLDQAPRTANLRTLSYEESMMILVDDRVFEIVQKGAQLGIFRDVCNLAALRSLPVLSTDMDTLTAARDDDSGREATILSWKDPFIGKAHRAFYAMMSEVCSVSASDTQNMYARSLAVVQSSGMGKSRMVDELSKEHFVIPINLSRKRTGFPPGDSVVSEFLCHLPFDSNDASYRAQAFLISLFETTAKIIPKLNYNIKTAHLTSDAQRFRQYMTSGQSCKKPGELRRTFYQDVIDRAKQILKLPLASSVDPLGLGLRASSVDVEIPLAPNSVNAEITESEDIIPMDTDDERKSGVDTVGDQIEGDMDTAEDQNMDCNSSPIINFIEQGKLLSLYNCALELVKVLAPKMSLSAGSLKSEPPLIILAYDDAHTLCFPKNEDKPRAPTVYSQHRRVIRGLRTLPIFSLFLSTTDKVHDLTPPPEYDSSDRLLNLTLPMLSPFTTLGFDQMVEAHAFKAGAKDFGINDVSKVELMVFFGRPLWGSRYKNGSRVDRDEIVEFTQDKLMHENLKNPSPSAKLALMSVRLALEFNVQTTEGRTREMEQVEKYMRVCILVQNNFETAVTISPSEPLLAEAARQRMDTHGSEFNMPASLLEHLTTMGLGKGDRGELAAQVLLILAADKACKKHLAEFKVLPHTLTIPRAFSVELFIKALLKEQWHGDVLNSFPAKWRTEIESTCDFQTAFKDTRIYFTHFIKLNDRKVVNREFLWRLTIRGCVALCADGQDGIDIIVPLVFGEGNLCRSNTSALFVQVKNDDSYKAQPNTILFDLMDPYLVRFFDKHEEPLPIIRMVFALGAPTAAVKIIPQYKEWLPHKANTLGVQTSRRYTSYDIWCEKASSETFGVIEKGDEQNYSLLLRTGKVFPHAYRSEFDIEEIESIGRSMNPGTSVERAHWDKWASFGDADTPQLPKVDLGDDVDSSEEDHEVEE